MAAMIVLVKLNEDVGPEDYERWVREDYLPAVKALPSVGEWRGYRVSGLLGSEAEPPFRYVVAVEIEDPEQLGRDMADEQMRRLLSELHELADVTRIMTERFAYR